MNDYNKLSILSGIKPVIELLKEQPEKIVKILCRKDVQKKQLIADLTFQKNIKIEWTDNEKLNSLCSESGRLSVSHQGVVAFVNNTNSVSAAELFDLAKNSAIPLILALDQVQDAGNIGSISRTAYALGCAGLLLPKHNTAALGPGAFRASAGALGKLPFACVTNLARTLDEAEEAGIIVYGTDANLFMNDAHSQKYADVFAFEWQFPAILVLGNENKGIRPGVAKRCSLFLTIPFARRFESLNIAQAAAIFIGLSVSQLRKQQTY